MIKKWFKLLVKWKEEEQIWIGLIIAWSFNYYFDQMVKLVCVWYGIIGTDQTFDYLCSCLIYLVIFRSKFKFISMVSFIMLPRLKRHRQRIQLSQFTSFHFSNQQKPANFSTAQQSQGWETQQLGQLWTTIFPRCTV